ncbi:hypothetical protein [Ectobacillus panaciterrae]|uniref:hypothetical protein n=1 Tax=Ectobacillus panaciterrae TaxID=363872 RepID=UPI00040830A0|nr:hypothetical protein [Ectobacillus panaciterrae]
MFKLDNLDRTVENLKSLILDTINNQISHKELADWCYEYCDDYWCSMETSEEDNYDNDKGLDVAMEIDTQWELFLTNTYSTSELQEMDFSNVKMPEEWLHNWLHKLV